jgi:hypothetical protein
MSIQGLRHTDNFIANQRPENWREGIMLLEPNGKAPLFALTSAMKTKVTDDPKFHWFEKLLEDRRIAITGNIVDGVVTTITVAATDGVNNALIAGFRKNMLIRFEQTGEIVRLTADPSSVGTTISVERGWGTTTAAALNPATSGVNPNMHAIGNVNEENSNAPTAINYDPTEYWNYTQIFRDTMSVSRTAQSTRLRTGDAVREAKRETLQYHSAGIELAFWLGERDKNSALGSGAEPARSTGGVLWQIAQGDATRVVDNAGAAVDLAQMEDWMELAFRYGSSEKMCFCGNAAMLSIQRLVRKNSDYQFMQGQKEFGMNVTRLISPFGELVIKTHPLFNQITGGVNTTEYWGLNSWLFILDMSQLEYRPLTDGDTKYQPKLQDNGLDGMLSGYLTEAGLTVGHAKTHLVVKRLGAGIVDA